MFDREWLESVNKLECPFDLAVSLAHKLCYNADECFDVVVSYCETIAPPMTEDHCHALRALSKNSALIASIKALLRGRETAIKILSKGMTIRRYIATS